MEQATYKFTIFLMKEHIKSYEECVKEEKEVTYYSIKKDMGIEGLIVAAKSSSRKPDWLIFLGNFCEGEIEIRDNVSNKAMMLVKIKNRIMALTFGYGRSFLKEESIEKNFGFYAALNMLNNKQIRSIHSATIEDMVVHTQKQSSYAASQEEFSMNAMNDIMMSIAGKGKNDLWANTVSGKDSLVVSVEMFPIDLKEKLEFYLSSYESDAYKEEGFAWVDNIREVRDVALKENLDDLLVDKLKKKDVENIYVSPPEMVDWDIVRGFLISGTGRRTSKLSNYQEDIDLLFYLNEIDVDVEMKQKIRQDKIYAVNVNEDTYVVTSLYSALIAQIEYAGELYILCDSSWYKIENDFYQEVKSYVASIPVSDIEFPDCHVNEAEGSYNERLGEIDGYYLMDKKLVGVNGGARKIEACDIFTKGKQFIHVKNRSSSAQLSHLFAQGRVSAECFNSDIEFRKQEYNKLKNKFGKDEYNYRKKPDSDEFEVVYAIIAKKTGKIEENLPFFSLVNLMLSVQELDRMHMKYSVKMILKN